MNRREFLARGAAGLAAINTLASRAGQVRAEPATAKPVRIGVIGLGNRGTGLLRILLGEPGVAVTAVCDMNAENVRRAAKLITERGGPAPAEHAKGPDDYKNLLQRDDVDAVLIAAPTKWHCPMAVAAMKAGKHVGSEVPAGFELDELWELVKTKEQTGRRYMLLENYAYNRRNMMILEMARQRAFGDPYYAECSYIHDCRFMLFKQDGSLDWWGEWAAKHFGSDYPTHALGPTSKWLGINEGDRLEYCSAMMSAPRVLKEYARKRFGPDSPQGRIDWALGEFISVLIHTAGGKLIRVDYDVNSPRPVSHYYLVQGTKGVYDSRAGVYFEEAQDEKWRPADEYREKYDHPYWRRLGEKAEKTGHGGGDFFAIHDFVHMVRSDREPWIDVYDAATWSVIFHCSRESIRRKGNSVEIPDFTGGRWKTADWRKDSSRPA